MEAKPSPRQVARYANMLSAMGTVPRLRIMRQLLSAHPQGMVVCMADGSCRTLSGSMSGQTWWAACTPAGGEQLGSDW